MRITIRSKLIVVISGLMVLLFALSAYLFISEKKVEMSQDIYVNSLAFSKLTAPTVAYDYDLYLAQNGFVYFNREVKAIFDQDPDVSAIKVISYQGDVLYDSSQDKEKRYEGNSRLITDRTYLDQVQSENISMKTVDGRIIFLKQDVNGNISFVDRDEKTVAPMEQGTLIQYLTVPATEKYTIVYNLSYKNLDVRVAIMIRRIIYLALFGILMGMLMSFVMSSRITKPIAQLVEGANEIAKGNFKTQVDIRTSDELSFLGQAFNKMAKDLESSVEARIYQERVASELKIASVIQQQLIPKNVPKLPGIEITAGIIPAEEIGGDMYDFLPIVDGKLMFYLGDVTGHGVPAGIVSSIASALFYGYSNSADLKKIIVDVNRVLKARTLTNMFMTLCLMQWDSNAKKFSYVNAGHEQIIHYKAKEKIVELAPAGGIALGMLPDISNIVKLQEIDLQPNDYLVIYSDGIPESWKNQNEIYGMERLQTSIKDFGNNLVTALGMKEAILSDVKQYVNGYKQMDDITIIVLKRTEN